MIGSIPRNTQFFGFIADENFNTLVLDSANADCDGFGMDNFVYVPVNSSLTRSFSINSDIVDSFDPVKFLPARGMLLTFDDVQNAPFNFSPTLGLLSVGGIWFVSYLRKKFYR